MIKIYLLAAIQGLTEFLPVSSSGHLVALQKVLDLPTPGVQLEVALHIGTLFSIVLFFAKSTFLSFTSIEGRREILTWIKPLAVATITTCSLALVIYQPIISQFKDISIVAFGFLVTGCILIMTNFARADTQRITTLTAILFGICQAVALIPGVSRTAVTISLLLFMGVQGGIAFRFSIAAVIPLLLMAAITQINGDLFLYYGFAETIMAIGISCLFGLLALHVLHKVVIGRYFHRFGYYCALLGLFILFKLSAF